MPRHTHIVTRTCVDCGETRRIKSPWMSDVLGHCQLCVSHVNISKGHVARKRNALIEAANLDDVVVQRLVDGEPAGKATLAERQAAAVILHLRGRSAQFIARRLFVSQRTAERYTSKSNQTGNQA